MLERNGKTEAVGLYDEKTRHVIFYKLSEYSFDEIERLFTGNSEE